MDRNRHFPSVHTYLALSYRAKGDLDKAIGTTRMNKAVLYETPYSWEEDNRVKAFMLDEEP
jgi:hypothetical protein